MKGTSSTPPTISVLMPVFNSANYLQAAIESLLRQSFQDFELLLLDDGSTDESLAIIDTFTDTRIRLFCDGKNARQPYRYNQGVQFSRGKYIAIMHSDDVAHPHRLAKQLSFLLKNPSYGLVGSRAKIIQTEKHTHRRIGVAEAGDFLRLFALFNCPFIHPTVLFRREVLEHLPYNEAYITAEDYELWSRVLQQYPAANLKPPLLQLRVHQQKNAKRYKTQQLENVVQIVRQQCHALDIPYQHEWSNSIRWVSNSYLQSLSLPQLSIVEQYLRTMHAKLLATRQFDTTIISNVLAATWLRVCMKSAKHGLVVWNIFQQSALSDAPVALKERAKLMLKCGVKR